MNDNTKVLKKAYRLLLDNWTGSEQSFRIGPWGEKLENIFSRSSNELKFPVADKDTFPEQYLWDSVATVLGYIASGKPELLSRVIPTINALCFLSEEIGFTPNASHSGCTSRSQPPLIPYIAKKVLSIESLFSSKGEKQVFANTVVDTALRDLTIWDSYSKDGLYHWFDTTPLETTPEGIVRLFRPESRSDARIIKDILESADRSLEIAIKNDSVKSHLQEVLGTWPDSMRSELAHWLYNRRLLCATGQDFTASYGTRPLSEGISKKIGNSLSDGDMIVSTIDDVVPVDLNCYMYRYLVDLFDIATSLNRPEVEMLLDKRQHLRSKMNRFLYSTEEGFRNYSLTGKLEPKFLHLSEAMLPLWCGICESDESVEKSLADMLELTAKYGIAMSNHNTGYQWDYNMWPLHVIFSVEALNQFDDLHALTIANGYLSAVEKTFELTGTIHEKYNPHNGTIETAGRYAAAGDFSWGAACYLWCQQFVSQ